MSLKNCLDVAEMSRYSNTPIKYYLGLNKFGKSKGSAIKAIILDQKGLTVPHHMQKVTILFNNFMTEASPSYAYKINGAGYNIVYVNSAVEQAYPWQRSL